MIELNKVSKENKNYTYKIIISFLIYALSIIITIGIVHIEFSRKNQLTKFQRQSKIQSEEKTILYKKFLAKVKNSLLAIKENIYFQSYISNSKSQNINDILFYTIMQENREYMQLSFVGEDGYEKIKFQRDYYGQNSYKTTILKNKNQDQDFNHVINLKNNEFYYSNINYITQNNKIQKQYIPIIKIATPIYIHNTIKGMLVVNVFVNKFINLLISSPIYDITIIDGNNTIKIHNKKIIIKQTKNLIEKDAIAKDIINNKIYIKKLTLSNKTIFFLFKTNNKFDKQIKSDNLKTTIIILIITIFLAIPFIFILGRPIKNMFELVLSQSDKIHELATNLDILVKQEIQKNTKKQEILIHQSRLAELGEMLSNIAHQWKHPLTRLSLLFQNLKLYKTKNKLTDEIFYKTIEQSNTQIKFMVETIDNFKNFYKIDKTKNNFIIKECIDNVLDIIGDILKHNNIEVIIKASNVELFGIKNELSQVILNIVINAKDALNQNNIKHKTIYIDVYEKNDIKTISIKDNAGGVDKNNIDKIFNPYFTTKKYDGTGIGLYISKIIIEDNMNGTLNISNDKHGAIFTIHFPKTSNI